FIWGRGTLDDKGSLVAQLEAVEALLAAGFKPKRTIYFAFGHDEEISGTEGAMNLAKELAKRKVHAEFSLDEGGSITVGVVPGESIASVEKHTRRVADDDGLELETLDFASEPSAPASDATPAFQLLEHTVNEVSPDAVVTAGLVIGATDNRHYGEVREARYNF